MKKTLTIIGVIVLLIGLGFLAVYLHDKKRLGKAEANNLWGDNFMRWFRRNILGKKELWVEYEDGVGRTKYV